ncbi:MAG: hypothetical protein IT182_00205 [Acidobacteria bacterium]|nr:hypothetical protein [Acidobacteriota bacterium]
MSMIHRFLVGSFAALALLVTSSTAFAAPIFVGQLSGDDYPTGLQLTVWNFSASWPDSGDVFEDLKLEVRGQNGDVLAEYDRLHLDVDDFWSPDFEPGAVVVAFGQAHTVALSLTFRGQLLSASLFACALDAQDAEGCFVEVDMVDEVWRLAGASIMYTPTPTPTPIPESPAFLLHAASAVSALAAVRLRRRRRTTHTS